MKVFDEHEKVGNFMREGGRKPNKYIKLNDIFLTFLKTKMIPVLGN